MSTRLEVFTARVTYGGADRLDITRDGKDPLGITFAPSERLLRPAKDRLKVAAGLRSQAADLFGSHGGRGPALLDEADRLETDVWEVYAPAYVAEMRVSYGISRGAWGTLEDEAYVRGVRPNRAAWREVLGRERVTAVCFCVLAPPPAPQRCHRRLWAGVLAKLGARDGGEVAASLRRSA